MNKTINKNLENIFKLNFDILIKNKRNELNKIAKNIGIKNITKTKDGKYLNKNVLVDMILKSNNYIFISECKDKLKKCNKCKIKKPFDEYHKKNDSNDGLFSICKKCRSISYDKRIKTLNGSLLILLNSSKSNSKKRKDKGRIDAGIFDITLSDLEEQWEKQNGRCYYSNIPMNYNKRDWKISLERLDPDKGYIKDNIVLCCQEFNGCSQWSKEKIKEMLNILDEDIIRHTFSFELEKKKYKIKEKIIKIIIDDIEYYNCTYCNKIKKNNEFTKNINYGCKDCLSSTAKKNKSDPRYSLQMLISNTKYSTKRRTEKNNNKRDNSFNIDFDYLVELYNEQKGLCAYSGIPLQFGNYKENNWTCSIERINVLKGYVKENVCLICYEFNTPDRKNNCKNNEEESCGWNKEKFKLFLNNII